MPPDCQDFRGGTENRYAYIDPGIIPLFNRFGIDLVLDIGANRGQYAAELRRAGYTGRIHSVEPLADAHQSLQAAAERSCGWTVAERCAVGATRSRMRLNIAGNSESSSLLPMLERHRSAAPRSIYIGHEEVEVRPLDDVAKSALARSRRPFLKLDVQGFEDQALAGATETLPRLAGLQVELDLTPLYGGGRLIEELLPAIRAAGFQAYLLRPGFTDRHTGELLQVDGIFFRKDLLGTPDGNQSS